MNDVYGTVGSVCPWPSYITETLTGNENHPGRFSQQPEVYLCFFTGQNITPYPGYENACFGKFVLT